MSTKRIQTYIAINGSSGCIPDNSMLCGSYESAVESLIELFELDDADAEELRENGIIYFTGREAEIGADYAEVTEGDIMTRKEYEKAAESWSC